jgi:hypothetical protein
MEIYKRGITWVAQPIDGKEESQLDIIFAELKKQYCHPTTDEQFSESLLESSRRTSLYQKSREKLELT